MKFGQEMTIPKDYKKQLTSFAAMIAFSMARWTVELGFSKISRYWGVIEPMYVSVLIEKARCQTDNEIKFPEVGNQNH